MNLLNVPEIAEGAYWYVLNKVKHPVTGDIVPDGTESNKGWTAWYSGNYCLVRTPWPISGVAGATVTVGEFMAQTHYSKKPWARVGGR